jgi:hypothetical protein
MAAPVNDQERGGGAAICASLKVRAARGTLARGLVVHRVETSA